MNQTSCPAGKVYSIRPVVNQQLKQVVVVDEHRTGPEIKDRTTTINTKQQLET